MRDGDHYIVDGQKTWTTLGQYADWIFCLVRTDPAAKKQAGISFLLIDMKTPGIAVRPIITIDGRHEVNEVFFDSVRVPVENLVGEENKGWDYAKFLLANERTGIARIGSPRSAFARVKRLAKETPGRRRDDVGRARFPQPGGEPGGRTEGAGDHPDAGGLGAGPARFLEARSGLLDPEDQGLGTAADGDRALVELAGPLSLPAPVANDVDALGWEAFAAPTYLNTRKVSIYGGSNEIQRNVIAKAILGL